MTNTSTKILIVDDDRHLRELMDMLLTTNGYDVTQASNGHEALTILKAQHFDLLLIDFMMPVLDGMELLRKLHGQIETPIIMLTAVNSAEKTEELKSLGASEVFHKPIDPEDIVNHIKQLF